MKRILSLLLLSASIVLATAQPIVTDTISEAVVTGTRGTADVSHLPVTVTVVEREALTAYQDINVLTTLSNVVPGLFVTSRGILGYGVSDGAAGGISIRGMQSGTGRVLVLIDGHPQYQGIFGHSIGDAYQTMGVERVEVASGPASVLYGSNGMGGVVNLITRKTPQHGSKTNLHAAWGSYGTFEANVSNQVHSGKFRSSVAGSYARTDGHRPRLGFEQISGQGKIGYDFSPHWQAEGILDVTSFIAHYPGTTDAPLYDARQKVLRGQAALNVDNNYGNTTGRISFYHNWGVHKINDGHAIDAAPKTALFRSRDALTGVNVYQNFALFKGNNLTVGFDYQRIRGEAWNSNISDHQRTGTSVDTTLHEWAGYIDVRQDLTTYLSAEVGLRYNYHSQTHSQWIPAGGLTLRLPHAATLKATVGKGFRNPTLRELYMWRPANASLEPERMMNYEIAWSQQLSAHHVRYGINLYMLDANNLIQTAMVDGAPRNINTGKARHYGIEAQATWEVCDILTIATNHSFIHMKNPMLDTPRYKGYLSADLHTQKWHLAVGAQAVGRLYTNIDSPQKRESFVLLHALLAYRFSPVAEIYVKGDNLLNRNYETRYGYPMPRATVMGGVNLNF